MSGDKRNADTLNTIGIVVVGICGAVLVYVTITALQAFYVNDTSDIQTMADYGGQDMPAKNLKAQQMGSITDYGTNPASPKGQTFRIPVEDAKKLVLDGVNVQKTPSNLVPALGPSDKATVLPIFGRPKAIPGAAPGSAAGSDAGSAAGSASGSDAGSAAILPTNNGSAEATGSGAGSGSGSAKKGNAP